ncbi:MAG: hypothetical protein AVDCRST_MAG07-2976, partial [uncultured Frankineae bacterium]
GRRGRARAGALGPAHAAGLLVHQLVRPLRRGTAAAHRRRRARRGAPRGRRGRQRVLPALRPEPAAVGTAERPAGARAPAASHARPRRGRRRAVRRRAVTDPAGRRAGPDRRLHGSGRPVRTGLRRRRGAVLPTTAHAHRPQRGHRARHHLGDRARRRAGRGAVVARRVPAPGAECRRARRRPAPPARAAPQRPAPRRSRHGAAPPLGPDGARAGAGGGKRAARAARLPVAGAREHRRHTDRRRGGGRLVRRRAAARFPRGQAPGRTHPPGRVPRRRLAGAGRRLHRRRHLAGARRGRSGGAARRRRLGGHALDDAGVGDRGGARGARGDGLPVRRDAVRRQRRRHRRPRPLGGRLPLGTGLRDGRGAGARLRDRRGGGPLGVRPTDAGQQSRAL